MPLVAGDHLKLVTQRSRSNQTVHLLKFETLANGLRMKSRPSSHHFAVHSENSAPEPHFHPCKPSLVGSSSFPPGHGHDATLNFSQGNDRKVKFILMTKQPVRHARFWNGLRPLPQYIRINQITHGKEGRLRLDPRLATGNPGAGQERMMSCNDSFTPRSAPQTNSSFETTTATGLPCRVMVCAPSVRARFTTSLKEFFASWSCHSDFFFFRLFTAPILSTRFCPV